MLPVAAQSQNQAQNQTGDSPSDPASNGPIRLRQPAPVVPASAGADSATPRQPYLPGEFERFVQKLPGGVTVRGLGFEPVRRLGAELVTDNFDARAAEVSPLVPPDYLVAPGDEILVTLWGSVDADLRLTVDRSGRISIPRVGTIQVSGVRAADLPDVISHRVAQVFKGYQISVSLGQLRSVRVYVTGFVVNPGVYTLQSLSTVVSALLRAGGPSASGSFRAIELRRGAQLVASFDLYDFLLRGDRVGDRILQAGDVVHVGPIGTQVAVIGSVNRPAIVELKVGETVADALKMAGGFAAVADRSRLALERLADRNTGRISQLPLPQSLGDSLGTGDVLHAFSAVDSALPTQPQTKRVHVDGEVAQPGVYLLPPASSIADALRAAGGLTSNAFIFGTEFSRESVREVQQQNYERALRDLEIDFARTNATQRVASIDEASAQTSRGNANTRLIERLRTIKPSGRIVLQLTPESRELPDLALEDGDSILVPPIPTSVGVFGSVFNSGSYLFLADRALRDYLKLAGGPTRGADENSAFVIRANGVVTSGLQSSGWFGSGSSTFASLAAEPGDTIFVPEKLDKTSLVQDVKDWTQIMYQFALGAAAIKTFK